MNVQELFEEVAKGAVTKRAITNHSVLNEAYAYGSAFSRGMRIDLKGLTILLISGTASIDEEGKTVHVGDLRAQTRRTFDKDGLLASGDERVRNFLNHSVILPGSQAGGGRP